MKMTIELEQMLATIFCLAFIAQGGLATLNCNNCLLSKTLGPQVCTKPKWWNPYEGCNTLGSGLIASKLAGMQSGLCPSLSSSSLFNPKYLPIFSTTTSQVPVFKSYFKPIIKTKFTRVPLLQNKVQALLSKFPCLKKKYMYPGIASLPMTKLSCLSGSCLKPQYWQAPCSPYSTFC